MSNYVQSTNFATKDALSSGNPLKIVKGTEINTEFANIAIAVATKGDTNANTTGTAGGLSGSPSITVTSVTVGSATNALGSSTTNTTLGNNTVFVSPATGFAPSVDNTYVLGNSTYKWSSVHATTYNIGTGTANITASTNNVVLNGVVAAVSGATPGFAPAANNTQFLGGSALKWKSFYLAEDFNWGSPTNYAIPAPTGGTTTFLRNDGTWAVPAGSGSGTVTSVSVTTANGFAGSVATATSTPAITLTTSITGVLKGNGTAISAATSGTDYVVPSGSITGTSGGLSGSPNITVTTANATTYNIGTGTANITASVNDVILNGVCGAASGALPGFYPFNDNTQYLGGAGLRWKEIYSAIGTINTSDARHKQQGRPLSDTERAVAVRIKGLIKTFKFNDAVEKKGDAARIHVGVYAQELADAFASEGLNAADYGMFCYDELNGTGIYGVRYEELLAFVISTL